MGLEPITTESQSIILPIKLYSPGNAIKVKGTGLEPAKGYPSGFTARRLWPLGHPSYYKGTYQGTWTLTHKALDFKSNMSTNSIKQV